MDLNDQAKVRLTAYGAEILNAENERLRNGFPNSVITRKTDYKEGDIYKGQLWDILGTFNSCYEAGHRLPFTQLEKID